MYLLMYDETADGRMSKEGDDMTIHIMFGLGKVKINVGKQLRRLVHILNRVAKRHMTN